MSDFQIEERTVADICQRNDIAFLGVFGSFARGDATAESDIDLLVRFARPKSLLDYFGVDRQAVWLTAQRDVPVLRTAVEQILRDLPPTEQRDDH
ncbi:MAG: nucleotidyltransferase domain-containing protein [Chloroflexi bacterium]|nr:nucleotidyltransferase domain-containing protein [Chloroflexota bacterium]